MLFSNWLSSLKYHLLLRGNARRVAAGAGLGLHPS